LLYINPLHKKKKKKKDPKAVSQAMIMLCAALLMVLGLAGPVDPNTMELVLMPEKAASQGAVCLDGSPGGFYYRAATDPEHKNDWLLHFKGAGWCFDDVDCLARSQMEFGSSNFWKNTTGGWNGGLLAPRDPEFGKFNKVILLYCDGTSFTSNRDDPLVVGGSPIYFRGLRIRDAIIETLTEKYGLANAQNVLLTGCSSGGLAAYLHQDALAARMKVIAPGMTKFRSAPVSGFFAQHDNVNGVPVYPVRGWKRKPVSCICPQPFQ
jgi:hypothetical protein